MTMTHRKQIDHLHFWLFGGALVLAIALMGATADAQMDHSEHDQHQQPEYNEEHQHDHSQMTQEQFDELRGKVQFYTKLSNEQIAASMGRMRNLGGMISDVSVVGDIGIMALAHGYSDEGNQQWFKKFDSISAEYPTGYGLGMAMMGGEHIQAAIDGLETAGAKTIVVLRTETGEANRLVYQWEYIFGRRTEAAYLNGKKVETGAKIIWGPSPTAHPLMGEIMLDHAKALSTDPANEMVIILGHGAMTKKENDMDLEIQAKHAAYIKEAGGFKSASNWNVQDDLPPEDRAKNVETVRNMIKEAKDQGMEVIVVTNVMTEGPLIASLKEDVEGTGAKVSELGLMSNQKFTQWVRAALEETLAKN